jgi:hypothetical protein
MGSSDPLAADSGGLDFKQFGLLAIQDGDGVSRLIRSREKC